MEQKNYYIKKKEILTLKLNTEKYQMKTKRNLDRYLGVKMTRNLSKAWAIVHAFLPKTTKNAYFLQKQK
jgi:hypothetical protein